jgi:hypothetical protein
VNRFFVCFAVTLIAFEIGLRGAIALGVQPWRGWPPGDAHDCGFVLALMVWVLIKPKNKPGE